MEERNKTLEVENARLWELVEAAVEGDKIVTCEGCFQYVTEYCYEHGCDECGECMEHFYRCSPKYKYHRTPESASNPVYCCRSCYRKKSKSLAADQGDK